MLYTEYLNAHGFAVTAVGDGQSTAREAERCAPAVVIIRVLGSLATDADPLAAAAAIRTSTATRRARIVLLTTDGTIGDRVLTTMSGCDVVMLLPVLPDDLAAMIEALTNEGG